MAAILMLSFCNNRIEFHMEKTRDHVKNEPTLALFAPLIDITKVTHSASPPLNKIRNLSPSHLITLPPYPPQSHHPLHFPHLCNLTALSLFPHCQPHDPPTFLTLPPTIKAIQNNNIRLSLPPHSFLRGGSQYQK